MHRTFAAAIVAAAMFALVSAQTVTQTQQTTTQQKTNTTTTQPTNIVTSPTPTDAPTTESTDTNATTMPIEPIEPIEPEPVPAPEATPMPRTGEKVAAKVVTASCPIHPEVKTVSAGKCPVCRMEERKQTAARAKSQAPLAQPDAAPVQTVEPVVEPTPIVEPTRDPYTVQPGV